MTKRINVLDKGYVRYVDHMGSDLTIVNAARVSYDKESTELSEKDKRLIKFLWENKHTSPFRHAAMTFEVYAPLLVARQWYKHAVASSHVEDQNGWNESSRRYVTEEPKFYLPAGNQWRGEPENKKQGSRGTINENIGEDFTLELLSYMAKGIKLYHEAQKYGICAEQARLFLPAYGMYVRWRWTASLHAILSFLDLRLPEDAQYEIRQYAEAVKILVQDKFPYTMEVINA